MKILEQVYHPDHVDEPFKVTVHDCWEAQLFESHPCEFVTGQQREILVLFTTEEVVKNYLGYGWQKKLVESAQMHCFIYCLSKVRDHNWMINFVEDVFNPIQRHGTPSLKKW